MEKELKDAIDLLDKKLNDVKFQKRRITDGYQAASQAFKRGAGYDAKNSFQTHKEANNNSSRRAGGNYNGIRDGNSRFED